MNPSIPPSDDHSQSAFYERMLRYQDGTLGTEEIEAFSAEMAGNPERQRAFIELQMRSALVREILQRRAYEVAEQNDSPTPITKVGRAPAGSSLPDFLQSHRWLGLGAVCAGLLICGALVLVRLPFARQLVQEQLPKEQLAQEQLASQPVAISDVQVAGISHAKFFGRGSLEAGQSLKLGHDCMLLEGMVKLAFPNGATAIIEGPAMFRVVDPECLALDTGACSVHAPDGAEGFRVLTPVTQVVDRGTRFSVKVHETTETEVQVIEGAADLIASGRLQAESKTPPASSPESAQIRLTERQAVRFSGFGKEGQKPTSYRPENYRRQLPDRIVDYRAASTENGTVRELQQVTVQRGGTLRNYSADELIPIEVTWFRSEQETDQNGHLLGGATPPQQRQHWLEDLRLDTGVINFGGGETPLKDDPVLHGPEGTPGLGIRFRTPVVNHAGPDVIFFEIQCFTNPLEGDPFHVSPVHFRPGLKTRTIHHYDLTMISPESREVPAFWLYRYSEPVRSLEELSTLAIEPNGGVMRLHFRALAVGVDLSDLGYAEGEHVEELFFQHATVGNASRVDPVLIAGLPGISETEHAEE